MQALELILGLYSGIITLIVGLLLWALKNFISSTNSELDELNKNLAKLNTRVEVFNQSIKNGYQQIVLHDKKLMIIEESIDKLKERILILEQKKP